MGVARLPYPPFAPPAPICAQKEQANGARAGMGRGSPHFAPSYLSRTKVTREQWAARTLGSSAPHPRLACRGDTRMGGAGAGMDEPFCAPALFARKGGTRTGAACKPEARAPPGLRGGRTRKRPPSPFARKGVERTVGRTQTRLLAPLRVVRRGNRAHGVH